MSRRSLLALVVTFVAVAVAGVGFAARTSGDTSVYGLVNCLVLSNQISFIGDPEG